MGYSIEQKTWTVISYENHRSFIKVQRAYKKKFGIHAIAPSNHAIKDWWMKFKSKGSVGRKARINTKLSSSCYSCTYSLFRWVRTSPKESEVLAKFEDDPHSSQRGVARLEEMPSRRSIQRILKVKMFLDCLMFVFVFRIIIFTRTKCKSTKNCQNMQWKSA
jgi:hypothetical protein